jgi:hypothetical protein
MSDPPDRGQSGPMQSPGRCDRTVVPVTAVRAAAGIAVTVLAAVLAGCASAAQPPGFAASAPRAAAAPVHTATLAQTGQNRASLAVLSGAATVTVSAASMPGQLVRVSTPAGSQIRPQLVEAGGQVQVFLASTGQSGPAAVWIQVSSAVTWQFQFSGGANQTVLNLPGGKVSGVDFTAGCSLIDLTLPRPGATVTITLAGGASQVNLTAPAGVPARLRLYGGASVATLDGTTRTGLSGGTVLTSSGWPGAAGRYDVLASAGVSMISVSAHG